MFLNKVTLRKASSRAALLLATGSLLATGISPAHALDATPLFISFESNDPLKALAVSADGPFGGTSTEIKASTNLDGDALFITKNGEPWAGVNILGATSTPYGYTAADKKVVTFDYWSPDATPSPVMLKLEAPGATYKAIEAQPGLNTISVDFTDVGSWGGGYTKLIIFPNFKEGADTSYTGAPAVANTGQVYEVDNISINGGTDADIYVPVTPVNREATSTLITFETGDAIGAAAAGPGFSGVVATIVDAPAGGNGGKALELEKAGDPWSGINLINEAPAGVKYLSATHKTITMNYYSPETVNTPVQINVIGTGSTISQAVEAVPGWQKLTFDFSATYDDTKEYTKIALFPNFVNPTDVPTYTGAAAVTPLTGKRYAIDNVGINGATTPAIAVPREATSTLLTFETGDTLGAAVEGAPTGQKPQGGFEGATTSIAVAPAGGNGGNALKITKNVGAQVYAGATFIKFGTDKRVTNGTHKKVTFNYYSPKDNSPVNVELRPYPNALGKIVNAPLGWSTITVDFTDVAGWTAGEEFTLLSIFPDFNQSAGDTALSYYVDNVAFNGAVTPEIPVVSVPREATSTLLTFETADTLGAKVVGDSTLAKPEGGFEGAVTSIDNAPALGNGGKALKIVKNVGAPTYAGVNIIRFGADKRVTNGTYKSITFNYYSPKTTSSVRVELRAFPNALGKTVAAPKGWSKITVDFTDVAGWTSTEEFVSVILFPDFDVAGAGDAFYVDNLAFNGATTPAIPLPKVKPTVKTAAAVGGTAKYAKTLTAGKGTWTGTATIAYTYKWYRCSVSSTKTATTAPTSSAKCVTISGATKSTYKLAKSDIGKYVRVLITAKNSAGTAYSLSKTTAKVAK
jgi:hypothetical protein